jgi:hypothetical protein
MNALLEAAVELSREQIVMLDDRSLIALADVVEAEIGGEPIVKESDRERALEKNLADELDEEFLDGMDDAIEPELALHPSEMTSDEAGMVVAGVGTRLERDLAGARGGRMRDAIGVAAAAMMILGRRAGISSVGASGRPTAGISGSLSMADRSAIAKLSGQQLFWVGRFYGDHLSKTIAATIRREALAGGLGRAEVGAILRGVTRGTFPGVAVPGTWRGSSESYFTMMAGTVRNQASNFGALGTFVEGGVTRYRIDAVMDARTSKICELMHGRTFDVQAGVRNMNARLDAETPEDARAAALWRSPEQTELLPGFKDDPEDALARSGMALPPYHGNCRTTIVAD